MNKNLPDNEIFFNTNISKTISLNINENIELFSNNNNNNNNSNINEFIFDRNEVRILFIILYILVFSCCFFGNLLVILVVTLSPRLRSITNFFLANLALADFCVGVFCVLQNLSIYLIDTWIFGEFLCRMYQFINSLSYTASIFILVIICLERYLVIEHPIMFKQILTAFRLKLIILIVWLTSALYSTPKYIFSKTIKNIHTANGHVEEICILDRKMFNSKLLDIVNFILLYIIPLFIMTILYSKIAIALWRSSYGLSRQFSEESTKSHNNILQRTQFSTRSNNNWHNYYNEKEYQYYNCTEISQYNNQNAICVLNNVQENQQYCNHHEEDFSCNLKTLTFHHDDDKKCPESINLPIAKNAFVNKKDSNNQCNGNDSNQINIDNGNSPGTYRSQNFKHNREFDMVLSTIGNTQQNENISLSQKRNSSNHVLLARRRIIRMLIIFVLTFAICNLPYHARKMWQYWSQSYRGDSNFNAVFTPITFLISYCNSGLNPLLYAFLSSNFRNGMEEIFLCSCCCHNTKLLRNSSMHKSPFR